MERFFIFKPFTLFLTFPGLFEWFSIHFVNFSWFFCFLGLLNTSSSYWWHCSCEWLSSTRNQDRFWLDGPVVVSQPREDFSRFRLFGLNGGHWKYHVIFISFILQIINIHRKLFEIIIVKIIKSNNYLFNSNNLCMTQWENFSITRPLRKYLRISKESMLAFLKEVHFEPSICFTFWNFISILIIYKLLILLWPRDSAYH